MTFDVSVLVPWHKRLFNLLIDIAVVLIFFLILGFIAGIMAAFGYDGLAMWFEGLNKFTDRLITTGVMVTYLFIMETFTQRSIGKYITGTMVVMDDGSPPPARQIIIRALCRILWIEAFSFIAAVPRGWHDSASNTYVVDAKKFRASLELKNSFDQIGLREY